MIMRYVYLNGTIQPEPKYLDWRVKAEQILSDLPDVACLSPVRGKNADDWTDDGMGVKRIGLPYADGGFVERDYGDIMRVRDSRGCFLSNMLYVPTRQSIGTFMEIGAAVVFGIPVVMCATAPEIIRHPFVYKKMARLTDNLEDAIAYVRFLLS